LATITPGTKTVPGASNYQPVLWDSGNTSVGLLRYIFLLNLMHDAIFLMQFVNHPLIQSDYK